MTARRAGGFAYIAAIIFLVVLAGFALAALRLADTAQTTVNQQLLGARANQAARAGLERAFYLLKPVNADCPAVTGAPKLVLDGFLVSVKCTRSTFGEGQDENGNAATKYIYELAAVACNGTVASCVDNVNPADLANPEYIERRRSASICVTSNGADCY
jgi:MSHA biogenesis protein MshP